MTVYTETVLHMPEPFQIAIITREDGTRVTGRIDGPRVIIGDAVVELEPRDGVPHFRKL
jgi:hypothetical protein